MAKTPTRKRPCRICRRWFLPDPRLKQRQMTCGQTECQRQWHKKKCSQWNRKNRDYFKANYLQRKIDSATQPRGARCSSGYHTGVFGAVARSAMAPNVAYASSFKYQD